MAGFDINKINLNNPIIKKLMSAMIGKAGDAAAPALRPRDYKRVGSKRIRIEMPDGVKLSAFLTKPKEDKAFPVILVRNPYVSNAFVYEGLLPVFAKYGYACLLVEVRGSQSSEGEWLPFEHEIDDGKAVLDWIAAQDFCDGNIGCFGGSYLGHTQWAVANTGHPALKSLFIQVYGPTPYDTFWRRGMFRQDIWSVWVTQMMGANRFKGAPPREQLSECLNFKPQDKIGEHFIGEHVDWYSRWTHAAKPGDAYWAEGFWGEFYRTAEETKVPILLEGGWNDIFLRPEIEAYRRLPEEIRRQSRFLIGPWNHGGQPNGDLAYPNSEDDLLFVRNGVEWFDYSLKGREYPHRLGVVDAYCIGGEGYVSFEGDIQHTAEKQFYITAEGTVSAGVPESGKLSYTYDPANCPENHWGNILGDGSDPHYGGPRKQRGIGERSDELSFLSDPLEEDVEISGAIRAELYVSSDVPATAFAITLSEVFENGEAYNIRNDITDIRFTDEETVSDYTPGSVVKFSLTMLDVLWRMKKGSRLRIDMQIAHQTVYCGDQYPTGITIPIR